MAHIMNMYRCMNPRPITFVNPVEGLERGLFLRITGMAKNNIWATDEDDFEAYSVELAGADTPKGDLVINTTVPKQYDERLTEADFVMAEGAVGRAHYIARGDEYGLPVDFVAGSDGAAIGDEVGLAADGMLEVGAGEAIGEITRVAHDWCGQQTVIVRFY